MADALDWKEKHFAFYQNKACEYFPCHEGMHSERFNCLFCYCPLYVLGKNCGGNAAFLENGIKDCSKCLLPHQPEQYGYIAEQFGRIVERMKQFDRMEGSDHGR
ncbi:MAG: cysteine-rich small domain-containing protein [Butyricicoccus sp.]